jgi:hypothetical protein
MGIRNTPGGTGMPDISPEQAQQIEKMVAEVGSMDQFRAFLKLSGLDPSRFADTLYSQALQLFWLEYLRCSMALLDDQRWQALASTPKKFDAELGKVLARIKRLMKTLYGIQSHRPVANQERDSRIWEMKQSNPALTFGQIGCKLRISPKVAERAYRNFEAKQGEDLKHLLELLMQYTAAPPKGE